MVVILRGITALSAISTTGRRASSAVPQRVRPTQVGKSHEIRIGRNYFDPMFERERSELRIRYKVGGDLELRAKPGVNPCRHFGCRRNPYHGNREPVCNVSPRLGAGQGTLGDTRMGDDPKKRANGLPWQPDSTVSIERFFQPGGSFRVMGAARVDCIQQQVRVNDYERRSFSSRRPPRRPLATLGYPRAAGGAPLQRREADHRQAGRARQPRW